MAGGEGCRDERRGSSASEVGTNDGTAKKKKKKKSQLELRGEGSAGRTTGTVIVS